MTVRVHKEALFDDLPGDAVLESIEPVTKDPVLRRLRAGGRTIATIRDADVEQLGLEEGVPVTPELREAIVGIVQRHKARKTVLNLLGRRAYSSAELTERLTNRGYADDVASAVVGELVDDGWVNDKQFASDLVAELLEKGPAGRPKLMQKLTAKKIPEALARQVVDEALEQTDSREAALDFARSKLSRSSNADGLQVARRLSAQLARRGVDQETIEDVISELGILDADSWQQ